MATYELMTWLGGRYLKVTQAISGLFTVTVRPTWGQLQIKTLMKKCQAGCGPSRITKTQQVWMNFLCDRRPLPNMFWIFCYMDIIFKHKETSLSFFFRRGLSGCFSISSQTYLSWWSGWNWNTKFPFTDPFLWTQKCNLWSTLMCLKTHTFTFYYLSEVAWHSN